MSSFLPGARMNPNPLFTDQMIPCSLGNSAGRMISRLIAFRNLDRFSVAMSNFTISPGQTAPSPLYPSKLKHKDFCSPFESLYSISPKSSSRLQCEKSKEVLYLFEPSSRIALTPGGLHSRFTIPSTPTSSMSCRL